MLGGGPELHAANPRLLKIIILFIPFPFNLGGVLALSKKSLSPVKPMISALNIHQLSHMQVYKRKLDQQPEDRKSVV